MPALMLTGLWVLFVASWPFSLAAMEISGSVLFIIWLLDGALHFQEWKKDFWVADVRRWIVVGMLFVTVGWLLSLVINQAGTVEWPRDVYPLRRLAYAFFPVWILRRGFRGELNRFVWWTSAALAVGFLLSVGVGLPYRDWENEVRYRGSFSIAFTYGAVASVLMYLVLWCAVRFRKEERWAAYGGALGIFVSVLLSGTRAAWVGFLLVAIAACIFLFRRAKTRLYAFITLVALVFLSLQIPQVRQRIDSTDALLSQSQRVIYAKGGWLIAKAAFPWGMGYKSPPRLMPEYSAALGTPIGTSHSHNHWIEVLAGTGVLSLLGWLMIFGGALTYHWNRIREESRRWLEAPLLGAWLQLFALSFFDVIFQDAEMSHATAAVLGFTLLERFRDRER